MEAFVFPRPEERQSDWRAVAARNPLTIQFFQDVLDQIRESVQGRDNDVLRVPIAKYVEAPDVVFDFIEERLAASGWRVREGTSYVWLIEPRPTSPQ